MADKLTSIKIKQKNGSYTTQIPVSVSAQNVQWDGSHSLLDILGSVDINVGGKGNVQHQFDDLYQNIDAFTDDINSEMTDFTNSTNQNITNFTNSTNQSIADFTNTANQNFTDFTNATNQHLSDVLGNISTETKGTVQAQMDKLQNDMNTFHTQMAAEIGTDVSDWLQQNVTPAGSMTTIDSSLTISDAAADAKAVGDALTSLNGSLSTLTAPNIGANTTWTDGKGIIKSTGDVHSYNAGLSGYIDISGCNSIIFTRRCVDLSSAPTSGMAFYDAEKSFVSGGVLDAYAPGGGVPSLYTVDVPENAVYARFTYLRTDDERITDYPFGVYDYEEYTSAKMRDVERNSLEVSKINKELSGLQPERTAYDDCSWVSATFRPTDGTSVTATGTTLIRTTSLYKDCRKITTDIGYMYPFVYDFDGVYLGIWDEEQMAAVKTSSPKHLDVIDLVPLWETLGNVVVKIELISDGIGETPEAPQTHVQITRNALKDGYVEEPINAGDWRNALIDYANGKIGNSATSCITKGYVPDFWTAIKATTPIRCAVYQSDGTFLGMINRGGGLYKKNTFSVAINLLEFNFEQLREKYSGCKFRLHLNGVNMGEPPWANPFSGIGVVTINTFARDSEERKLASYEIPTRFARDTFYTETPENVSVVSNQSMCTDDTYIYVATLQDNYPYIRKINMSGELVTSVRVAENIGHCNDMTYNPNDGYIYIVYHNTYGNRIYRLSTETCDIVDYVDVQNVLDAINAKTGLTITRINRLAYFERDGYKLFLVGFLMGIAVCDAGLTTVLKIIYHRYPTPERLRQGIFPMGDYILAIYTHLSGYDKVDIYDWNGRLITSYSHPFGLGTGYDEIESMCIVNGDWYWLWNMSTHDRVRVVKGNPIGYEVIPVGSVEKQFTLTS